MAVQTLTKWIKAGYPHLKEGSGLPAWLLPERSMEQAADDLGDRGTLEISRPLGLADGIQGMLERAPEPGTVPGEVWREAIAQWPPVSHIKPVVEAFFEASDKIMAQFDSGQLGAEPVAVCRTMAVLLVAPFVEEGRPLLKELSRVLCGEIDEPAQLIRRYAEAVVEGDTRTVEKAGDRIAGHATWTEWAATLVERARHFPSSGKLIAVTPPLSAEIAEVLASMVEETEHDEPGRDHPEEEGRQVSAR